MTPQFWYAVRRVVIMIVLSALGIFGSEAAGLIQASGLDPLVWGGIVSAVLSSAVRVVEGIRDGKRAKKGEVIKEDVKPLAQQPKVAFDYELLR